MNLRLKKIKNIEIHPISEELQTSVIVHLSVMRCSLQKENHYHLNKEHNNL